MSDDDAFEEQEPELDTSFRNTVVVDGLPVVPDAKFQRLTDVVTKFFAQVGNIHSLHMPQDENNSTLGYAFIQFQGGSTGPYQRPLTDVEEAKAAVQKANGVKLDKSHTFIVNLLEDYHKYAAVSDIEAEYVPPVYKPREHLHAWLLDEKARDQFVVRYAEETEIWWNDPTDKDRDPAYARKNWSDSFVRWSPRGAYLATFHRLGIVLWGGESWQKLLKLSHGGVKLVDFSPCERFLVTWSPEGDLKDALILWDVKSGAELRRFAASNEGAEMESWPVFRWSHDGSYFARVGENCIYVYESTTQKLIHDQSGKRSSVKADGVRDFLWSPSDMLVSMWIPEHENQPAKVVLMDLPSRKELTQKNLFNVADLRMTWHPQGHFLCVKVDKHSKSKKTMNSAFELFRLRDKGVPIEVQEFSKDTKIVAFAWEPKGQRFAIVHSDVSSANRTDVSLYSMGSVCNGCVSLIKTFDRKPCNSLFWSPAGNILLLVNLKGTAGQLEWLDANVQQAVGEAEHFMCSDVEWDPTGRYVSTSVCHWRHQMENGFNIWSSHGKQLDRMRRDKFFQFLWRPRPPSLLSDAKEKEIRKNLREYSRKYEEMDAKLRSSLHGDKLKARQERHRAFEEALRVFTEEYNAMRAKRIEIRGGVLSDDEDAYTYVEDVEEEEIAYEEETIEHGDVEIGDD